MDERGGWFVVVCFVFFFCFSFAFGGVVGGAGGWLGWQWVMVAWCEGGVVSWVGGAGVVSRLRWGFVG